jgi:hypothetical protein
MLMDGLDSFQEFPVSYAVVGALATSFHGVPRSTKDADAVLWLRGAAIGFKDIASRLSTAGYSVDARTGDPDDPIGRALLIKDAYGNLADLRMDVRGMDPAAAARCVQESVLDTTINILGAEDLIAMKVSAGRPQDIVDVRGVLMSRAIASIRICWRALTRRYGRTAVRRLDALLRP